MLGLQILAYSFALWLGLYLFARNPAKPLLRLAGLGLLAYALSLAFSLLRDRAPTPSLAVDLARLQWALNFPPALFWSGALFWLVPESQPLHMRLARVWSYGLVPATAVFCLLTITSNWILDFTPDAPRAGPGYLIFAAVVVVPLLAGLVLTLHFFNTIRPKQPMGLIIAATLFFGLSVGLLIFPLDGLPREWVVAAIGVDLALLGVAVAALDAFDEGETLFPDIARSFAASSFIVVLFGGQVALAIVLGEGLTFPLLALLLAIIAAAIGVQVFSDWIQSALDRLVFARFPRLQRARSDLRAATSALPRMSEALDPSARTCDRTQSTADREHRSPQATRQRRFRRVRRVATL